MEKNYITFDSLTYSMLNKLIEYEIIKEADLKDVFVDTLIIDNEWYEDEEDGTPFSYIGANVQEGIGENGIKTKWLLHWNYTYGGFTFCERIEEPTE